MDFESNSVPSYLQPEKQLDLDSELNFPAAPGGHVADPDLQQESMNDGVEQQEQFG